jgi:hypothetical protein
MSDHRETRHLEAAIGFDDEGNQVTCWPFASVLIDPPFRRFLGYAGMFPNTVLTGSLAEGMPGRGMMGIADFAINGSYLAYSMYMSFC